MNKARTDQIYDIAIIGAGIIGSAIARELSKYKLKILLLEKASDAACGITKANSGVIHAGFNNRPGSLKARLCVEGNRAFPQLCSELNVPMKYIGKLVIAKKDSEIKALETLHERGKTNKVPKLKMVYDPKEISKLEPNIAAIAALYSGTSGILQPWQLNIALAENAHRNGVEILLNTEVIGITKKTNFFILKTQKKLFRSRWVINCAGLGSVRIARMVGLRKHNIYPCRGEYLILDKDHSNLISGLIYPAPSHKFGLLGVHLTPTIEGVVLIGPSSEFINETTDTGNTREIMARLLSEANDKFNGNIPGLDTRSVITSYSGIRPKLVSSGSDWADFVIREEPKVPGFINLIGIESPGLTAAPAIVNYVVNIISTAQKLRKNPGFKPNYRGFRRVNDLTPRERSELIEQNPEHGKVVCRCEFVTRQEVLNALEGPLGVNTINSIRYRTRATMGRCQGGFCGPKLVEILEKEYNIPIDKITLKGGESRLFVGRTKQKLKKELNDKR